MKISALPVTPEKPGGVTPTTGRATSLTRVGAIAAAQEAIAHDRERVRAGRDVLLRTEEAPCRRTHGQRRKIAGRHELAIDLLGNLDAGGLQTADRDAGGGHGGNRLERRDRRG